MPSHQERIQRNYCEHIFIVTAHKVEVKVHRRDYRGLRAAGEKESF